MALLERTSGARGQGNAPSPTGRSRRSLAARRERRERRWSPGPDLDRQRPSRSLLVALGLASATLMTLDLTAGGQALDPVRGVVADVVGPAEAGATALVSPVLAVPDFFRTHSSLRGEVAALEEENTALRAELGTVAFQRNRLAAYDELTATAEDLGYSLVPSRVVGWGPAQSFSSTVTIDAGTDAGVRPDMTVVSGAGLVGRVVSAGRTTATVLLIIDPASTVGARIGDTMDMGFLTGRGVVGDEGRLDLELVDRTAVPARADSVVTWGSDGGAPYVSGVPIGRVTRVYSSLRETSQRVVVDPHVDFGALDVVGVVVPTGTTSDRALVGPDGELSGESTGAER
jgi:rod shape-determining protein MreC